MIYLDTAFCIYLIEDRGRRGQLARELVNSDLSFAVSPLVLMECLVKPLRESDVALEDDYRQTLGEFRLIEIGPPAYERAARRRAGAGVRTPDALHWATAALAGCAELWTGDASFAAKSAGFAVDQFAEGARVPGPGRSTAKRPVTGGRERGHGHRTASGMGDRTASGNGADGRTEGQASGLAAAANWDW